MYISKVDLKNIRCFNEISIDFEKDGKPVLWTVILGDNAVGKSTLLKSIAMGLCDETSAGALMKESQGEFLRKNEKYGSIEITLKKEKTEEGFTIKTEITKESPDSPEKINQFIDPKTRFPWEDLFVCGYGVYRVESGSAQFKKYIQLEALYSLFTSSELMGPELILLRQSEKLSKLIEKKLLNVLMLDEKDYSIEHTNKGMVINGPWGAMTIDELSDGYRSTTNWIMDFFGWQIFADRINENAKISGILLLDELENHLHPKWQREIVYRLKKQLPDVQFIVSTHSPLIASSVGSIKNDDNHDKIIYLDLKDGNKVIINELESLKGFYIDQVLASKAFDYITEVDPEVENVLREASVLAGKADRLTPSENKRYQEIKKALKNIMKPRGSTLIEREIQREIYEVMKKNIKELEKIVFSEEND